MPASAADAPAGASSNPSVWYASFGSNILSERFACYLEGGRIEGMIRDMPGSRDPSPPTEWRRWDDLPHRLFFAHSSPTWDGGGVAFVDFGEDLGEHLGDAPETPSRDISSVAPETRRSALGVSYRLYRVTLEQFNDVLAQENGMVPGDEACREMTAEEARALADAWTALVPETRAVNGAAHAGCLTSASASDAGGRPALRNGFRSENAGPPGETRAPSERWYGYVKCIGALNGEPVLTFSCDAETTRRFRTGADKPNAPSAAYYEVIKKGLVQSGSALEDATAYLDARVEAAVAAESHAGEKNKSLSSR